MADDPDRIDYDERGDLDDIVVHDVATFRMERMERMDTGQFWIRCYRDGKPDVVFNLSSSRKITGNHHLE